jgi:hypothetical protein
MRSLYPTLNDLKLLLSGSGTPVAEDGQILAASLDASIDGFETEVGGHMLATKDPSGRDRTPVTKSYLQEDIDTDREGMGFVNLEKFGSLARIDSVSFIAPNTAPKTLVELTDWWRMPANAADMNRPWKWLRVLPYSTVYAGLIPIYSSRIDITGLWGWPAIPGDAWLAMLYGAAGTYFEGSWSGFIAGGTDPGPVKSATAPGGSQIVYDTSWWAARQTRYLNSVMTSLNRYRRLSIT